MFFIQTYCFYCYFRNEITPKDLKDKKYNQFFSKLKFPLGDLVVAKLDIK